MTNRLGLTLEPLMAPTSVLVFQLPALPMPLGANDDVPELVGQAALILEAVKQLRDGFHAAIQGMIEESCAQPANIDFKAWTAEAKKRWLDYYLKSELFDEEWRNRVERYATLLLNIATILPRYRAISERFLAIKKMIGEYREDFESLLEETISTIAEHAPRRMFRVIDDSENI